MAQDGIRKTDTGRKILANREQDGTWIIIKFISCSNRLLPIFFYLYSPSRSIWIHLYLVLQVSLNCPYLTQGHRLVRSAESLSLLKYYPSIKEAFHLFWKRKQSGQLRELSRSQAWILLSVWACEDTWQRSGRMRTSWLYQLNLSSSQTQSRGSCVTGIIRTELFLKD